MSYGKFAYLYDDLMRDFPYDQWVNIVLEKTKKYQVTGSKLLDLGCGTGELSVHLAGAGYTVTGVDLSEDMLAIAQSKAQKSGAEIHFYQQNMAELEGFDRFDVIGVFCDSLNYLETETEVIQTFRHVFSHLQNGGLFVFDVHSLYKIHEVFMDQTFTRNDREISYIWNCFQGEHPNSIEHDLSFFVLDESTGQYNRFDELHFQRTYSIEQYERWLTEAGFELLEITADFEGVTPQAESERIFFFARKPSLV